MLHTQALAVESSRLDHVSSKSCWWPCRLVFPVPAEKNKHLVSSDRLYRWEKPLAAFGDEWPGTHVNH